MVIRSVGLQALCLCLAAASAACVPSAPARPLIASAPASIIDRTLALYSLSVPELVPTPLPGVGPLSAVVAGGEFAAYDPDADTLWLAAQGTPLVGGGWRLVNVSAPSASGGPRVSVSPSITLNGSAVVAVGAFVQAARDSSLVVIIPNPPAGWCVSTVDPNSGVAQCALILPATWPMPPVAGTTAFDRIRQLWYYSAACPTGDHDAPAAAAPALCVYAIDLVHMQLLTPLPLTPSASAHAVIAPVVYDTASAQLFGMLNAGDATTLYRVAPKSGAVTQTSGAVYGTATTAALSAATDLCYVSVTDIAEWQPASRAGVAVYALPNGEVMQWTPLPPAMLPFTSLTALE